MLFQLSYREAFASRAGLEPATLGLSVRVGFVALGGESVVRDGARGRAMSRRGAPRPSETALNPARCRAPYHRAKDQSLVRSWDSNPKSCVWGCFVGRGGKGWASECQGLMFQIVPNDPD